jgi:hypothetical protein
VDQGPEHGGGKDEQRCPPRPDLSEYDEGDQNGPDPIGAELMGHGKCPTGHQHQEKASGVGGSRQHEPEDAQADHEADGLRREVVSADGVRQHGERDGDPSLVWPRQNLSEQKAERGEPE